MNIPLSPYIRKAWYSTLAPNENIRERVIFDYELIYIKEGTGLITVEDREYPCSKGDVYIFRPGQRHSITVPSNSSLVQPHIHFDLVYSPDREQVPICYRNMDRIQPHEMPYFREDILDHFHSPFPNYIHPHAPGYIEQMVFDVIYAYDNPTPHNDITLSHLFLRLWEQVLTEISYGKGESTLRRKEIPQRLKLYIEQNLSHSITLDDLANLVHFSRSYVSRVFQDSYNISPMRYHTLLRVQKAKQMIQYTNLSLSEVAFSLGFESLQDFSRVFKKSDGMSPSNYRYMSQQIAPPDHEV